MTDRIWIEMPVVRNGMPDGRVRPKYPVETNATIIYKDGKAYIDFKDAVVNEVMSGAISWFLLVNISSECATIPPKHQKTFLYLPIIHISADSYRLH